MLAAKMDLSLKKLDEGNKQQLFVPVHAMSSHSACEVCGDGGHLRNDCTEACEDAAYINNSNFNSNFNSSQPSLKDLVFGQAKINESLNKKLAANDKVLENINAKVETLSYALKNQLSFQQHDRNTIGSNHCYDSRF